MVVGLIQRLIKSQRRGPSFSWDLWNSFLLPLNIYLIVGSETIPDFRSRDYIFEAPPVPECFQFVRVGTTGLESCKYLGVLVSNVESDQTRSQWNSTISRVAWLDLKMLILS